jgi:hypothetical protein
MDTPTPNIDVGHPAALVLRHSGHASRAVAVQLRPVPAVLRRIAESQVGPPIVEHIAIPVIDSNWIADREPKDYAVEPDLRKARSANASLCEVPLISGNERHVDGIDERHHSVQENLYLGHLAADGDARGIVSDAALARIRHG